MPDVAYDAILGALTLRQVLSGGFDAGAQVIAGRASGAIDPSELYGAGSEPKASFSTGDLAGLITAVSLTAGLSIASGTITIPFQKRAQQGEFQGATSHPAISGTDGLLVITGIESSQDAEAVTAAVDLYFRSTTGAADPVSGSTGQSLASQAFSAQFGHGPAWVNGSELNQVVGWRVNPGLTVRTKRYQGLPYPTSIHIVSRDPSIDLIFEEFDDAMTFLGSYSNMTAVDVYARKRADGGTHVAEATTQHAKFSFTDGLITAGPIEASGQSEGQATIRCRGLALTGSIASAIP